ncbi:MAG: hypothetical protein LBJ61_10070 [Deltaproteobacteria bacterium]|jgi:hypothetical protein|nr:hypothetical protein [Deltaproteobacteria bacterium]
MLTFSKIEKRLRLLLEDLDGEFWTNLLERLNPPENFPKTETVHDLCFRDAKALAGYVPDLRAVMRNNLPKDLPEEEVAALRAVRGLLNFSARIPVLILYYPDYRENENLINVYNGYRQTLRELDDYLARATNGQ